MSRGPKLIPESELSEIFAQMFLTDQWINRHTNVRRQVDTTLLYDPIFEKYGYTFEDYYYSVSEYIERPDRFQKVMQNSSKILQARQKQLEAAKEIEDNNKKLIKSISGFYDREEFELWRKSLESNYEYNVEREDSLRTDQEPTVRQFSGDKLTAPERKNL